MTKKKVLIISYYWPPSGGISVLRSLKISKYLNDFGWEPVILTVDNPQYTIIDETNNKYVDKRTTVIKAKAFQPFDFYKKITGRSKKDTLANVLNANSSKQSSIFHRLSVYIRANFFIPDARSMWIKPALKVADQHLKNNSVDAIFSDGPPHTNTLIACQIAKKHNLPWLMDWQDPWTEVDYYSMFPIRKRADAKHKKLEQMCLKQANAMTIVSPSWKEDAENLGASNVDVIYWGYDKNDFEGLEKQDQKEFIISHLGLLGEDRVSESLFVALNELCNEDKTFASKLKVHLYGTVCSRITDLVNKYNLQNNFIIKGQVQRQEALQLILDSDINLLLLNIAENAKGRIPGKLFEYIYANNSILNLGPINCDVQNILSDTQLGQTFEYSDKEGIKSFIINQFNVSTKTQVTNKNLIEPYSIQNQTKRIAQLLDGLTLK